MGFKTGKQVQEDVYRLLRDSTLSSMISGAVYRKGERPRNSKVEDAVVIFTTGLPDQIQTGVVTVNIYVPDIDPFGNGVLTEDSKRTAEIESLAQAWVNELVADVNTYNFSLQLTIYTEAEADIHQHFVVIRLKYELFEN